MQALVELTGIPTEIIIRTAAGLAAWALLEIAKRFCNVPEELKED